MMLKTLFNNLYGIKKMNKPTLLIIGAAGNNGVATIKALMKKHPDAFAIRAGVRSEAKAKELKVQFPEIETAILDLDKPDTLPAAYQGVQKLFLIIGNVENREEHAKNAIDAAVVSGTVKDVLFYSVVGAEYESILFGKQFRAGEKYLEASGLNWTHLRTIFFQENFAGWADGIKQGALYFGIRDGQFAPLNIADIGEIAASVLSTDGHAGKAYNITGPELHSGNDMAKIFSEVLELFELFASNQAAFISPDGEQLLGRPMTTLMDYAQFNRALFT